MLSLAVDAPVQETAANIHPAQISPNKLIKHHFSVQVGSIRSRGRHRLGAKVKDYMKQTKVKETSVLCTFLHFALYCQDTRWQLVHPAYSYTGGSSSVFSRSQLPPLAKPHPSHPKCQMLSKLNKGNNNARADFVITITIPGVRSLHLKVSARNTVQAQVCESSFGLKSKHVQHSFLPWHIWH